MATDKKDESIGKNLLATGVQLAFSPLNAYVGAWSASKLWEWFLQAQYGSGPSLGAWFGLSLILMLLTAQSLVITKKEDDFNTAHMRIIVAVVHSIACLGTLLSGYVIGSILGWIG